MFEVVAIFGVGVLAGIITSVNLGPTNLWLLQSSLFPRKPLSNVGIFIFGLILFDSLYAAIGFAGYQNWILQSSASDVLSTAVAILFIGLGIFEILQRPSINPQNTVAPAKQQAFQKSSFLKDFMVGLGMGANPSYIIYWIAVAKILISFPFQADFLTQTIAAFAGIVSGDIAWYSTLIFFFRKKLITYERFQRYFRWMPFFQYALGFGFILLGLLQFYHVIKPLGGE